MDIDCCEYSKPEVRTLKRGPCTLMRPSKHGTSLPRIVSPKPHGLTDSGSNLLELRLIHHYTKSTCGQQSLKAMVPLFTHPMWEVDVPQIAFSSGIVLNALLGISALNLLSLTPHDQSLALASQSYFHKAVTEHRNALAHVDAHNAEPLLVAAVLIAHHTWLTAHTTSPEEPYKIDLQTYHMCQGIQALLERTTPWLDHYNWPSTAKGKPQVDSVLYNGFLEDALEDMRLISGQFNRDGMTTEDQKAYEAAAEEIIAIYFLVSGATVGGLPAEQEIVTILHRLPSRFVYLLKREDPIAMALFARNLAMLQLIDDSKAWWIHGSGVCRVPTKAVEGISGLMPPKWLWTMDWPQRVITKEVKLAVQ